MSDQLQPRGPVSGPLKRGRAPACSTVMSPPSVLSRLGCWAGRGGRASVLIARCCGPRPLTGRSPVDRGLCKVRHIQSSGLVRSLQLGPRESPTV